ncbi:hypothetical protein ACFL35_21170 [Candidatus Riflebacteria bacterium]
MRNLTLVFFSLLLGNALKAEDFFFPLVEVDYQKIIESYGVVQPVEENYITVPRRYNGSIDWVIDEGVKVKKGDLLLKLDRKNLEQDLDRLLWQEKIQKSRGVYIEFEEKVDLESKDSALLEKKQSMEAELFKLNHLQAPPIPEQVRNEELTIKSAQNQISFLKNKLKAQKTLKDKGFLSRLEYEKIAFNLEKNNLRNEEGKLKLQALKKPDIKLQQQQYKLQYEKNNLDFKLMQKEQISSRKLMELKAKRDPAN